MKTPGPACAGKTPPRTAKSVAETAFAIVLIGAHADSLISVDAPPVRATDHRARLVVVPLPAGTVVTFVIVVARLSGPLLGDALFINAHRRRRTVDVPLTTAQAALVAVASRAHRIHETCMA